MGCSELRELVLTSSEPTSQELDLIASITSVHFRKIVFMPRTPYDQWTYEGWKLLDIVLSQRVDRLRGLGQNHTLELEFRPRVKFTGMDSGAGPGSFFPNFRVRGRVSIFEVSSGRVVYCSDG